MKLLEDNKDNPALYEVEKLNIISLINKPSSQLVKARLDLSILFILEFVYSSDNFPTKVKC